MFTWGSKLFFGLMGGALIGAVVYGLVTGGDPVGVISAGYKGGVGDHVGYTILLFAAAALFILGTVSVLVRDGDAEIMAARVGTDVVPVVNPPSDPSYWGLVLAFGIASIVVGLALSTAFLVLGIATVCIVALMWTVLAWSDRATGDPEVNRVVRHRLIGPVEVPMLSLLAIGVIAVGVSRVFLAVSATGAVVFGTIFTLFVFVSAILMSKLDLKRGAITAIVTVGALTVLFGGIIGAAVGERDFHHGEEEHHSDDDHSEGEG